MKKKSLFLPLVAALALTGCSNDDLDISGGDSAVGEGRYIAVSIVATDNDATRATGDPAKGEQYDQTPYKYEDGLAKENAVKGLRIYFFDAQGEPVDVKNNGGNYYNVPMDSINKSGFGNADHSTTVEKKINAVLLVNTGERVPSKLVAVVNPTEELGTGSYNLTDLRRFINNYASFANEQEHFVMTNSTYVDGGSPVLAQTVMPENFQKDPEVAKQKPVTIYVERCVAKVRLKNAIPGAEKNTADGGIMFPVVDKKTGKNVTFKRKTAEGTEEEVAVYVKFLGWDITADLQYGWLLKNIRAGWRENLLGTNSWNDAKHHRSYWADVCGAGINISNNVNQYFSYSNEKNFTLKNFDGTEWKYCNENAEKKNTDGTYYKPTEVIIKGELCDQNGNPLTFTEIAGTRILDDANSTNLKNTYLAMLKGGRAHTHWKVTRKADGTIDKIREIAPEDITFMTATEQATSKSAKAVVNDGRYYVYACLTKAAADPSVEWYTGLNVSGPAENPVYTPDPDAKVDAKEVNDHLLEMGKAKIWNSGKTYYYTTIMHVLPQGVTTGTAGVVRNHIYDINLKNVYGFGTPVYNPDEIIIPEKPQKDDTYVAAEINILSWCLVESNVDLEWD